MKISTEDLLRYAIENGMIDTTSVAAQIMDMEKKKIIEEHQSSVWYSEKEGYWYCCLPDETKKSGWRNVKRKKREDIEAVLVDFYLAQEEQQSKTNMSLERKSEARTVEDLYWEFMEYKKQLVKAATIVRIQADWERFYIPHPELIKKPYKQIKKTDIDLFFNRVLNEHELKDKAFHNMCGVLKQVLQYAVDSDYMDESPYRVNINKKKTIHRRKTAGTEQVYTQEEKRS